jgi:hypothetical protein
MPKRNNKAAKHRSAHDDYELPKEVDFSRTKFIGFGLQSLERRAAAKRKTVVLEADVARDFATSADVNQALRLVQQLRQVGGTAGGKRKTA